MIRGELRFITPAVTSERLNLSPHTLRYYEKDGLIPRIGRKENGQRVYTETDIVWLQVVQCLRKSVMSVANIREYNKLTLQGNDTIAQRKELVLRQREIIEAQIKEYQELLRVVDFKLQYFDQHMEYTTILSE